MTNWTVSFSNRNAFAPAMLPTDDNLTFDCTLQCRGECCQKVALDHVIFSIHHGEFQKMITNNKMVLYSSHGWQRCC